MPASLNRPFRLVYRGGMWRTGIVALTLAGCSQIFGLDVPTVSGLGGDDAATGASIGGTVSGLGTASGLVVGLWLALSPFASRLLDPYIIAVNSMPRVILAPIFAVWFGLGILSKVALGITLVFFIVFFNVYQGVKEVSPVVLNNARMLGANRRQLLRTVYLPSAMSWVFSSLHTSVGMAFVGAVVGEYLGSARGVGYLILQAEGAFDINTVFAGILVLTAFALALDTVVTLVENRLLVWRPAQGETEPL